MYALFLVMTHGTINGSGLTDDENAKDPNIHGCTMPKSALDKPETGIVTIFIYCLLPG